MDTTTALKNTPLSAFHESLGAQMAPFAGWNMPIQYEGIINETLATRKSVCAFDICHMGEFLIKGHYKKSGLDRIISAPLENLAIGACRYSSILNAEGGIIDDLIVYRKGLQEWMIVINAATIEKDKAHFLKNLTPETHFEDPSCALGKIDLQGPLSRSVLETFIPTAKNLKYFTFCETDVCNEKNIVSRTGYTGELGFEIYASDSHIQTVWKKLLENKLVKPAGLGARDVLRLEMGYSLYGQDIDETITPLEAGLEKFIDFEKDFIGKDALLKQKKQGLKRQRFFFKSLSRRSPRHLHKIYLKNREIGLVTSGTFSPHLECGIGMGFASQALEIGENISFGDERIKIEAVVCEKPFVKKTSIKN
jgi:aminomethyltransferase